MKPFGVRLAAGAVTILLGALAAAQAQKDQQNQAQSEWVVTQPPSLSEPPTPIQAAEGSVQSGEGSVQNPDGPEWSAQPVFAAMSSEDELSPGADAVQLVQHSQPNETAPADQSGPGDGTGFSIPSDDSQGPTFTAGASAAGDTGMGFAIVDSTTGEVMSSDNPMGSKFALPANAGDPSAPGEPVEAGTIANMSMPDVKMTLPDGPSLGGSGAPNPGQNGATATAMPELQFEQPPGMSFADPSDAAANVPGYGQSPTGPANDLRGGEFSGAPSLTGTPSHAPMPASSEIQPPTSQPMNGNPQSLLRTVQAPVASSHPMSDPSAQAHSQPASSQPRFVDPVTPPASQPTLRYAQTPDSQLPVAANPSISAAVQPNHFTPNQAVPAQQPAARIASLPQGNFGDAPYAPRPIGGPVAAAPIAADPEATIASPGDRRLEGIQSPSIVIHKRAPSEVKVGKPASFVIHVQNVGSAEALGVTVHDRVPAGMRLVDASPTPVQQGDALVWQLGAMSVGDERTVTMQLIPEQEGELGSVARVTFEAAASVRTLSTRPELKIVQKGPPKVLIGQQLEIELEVSNPGTGDATGVLLQEDVPDGLEHPKGRQLDNLLGTLAAGEVRRQVLRLRAVTPGVIQNQIRLTGDDGLEAVDTIEVEVVSPQLQVALNGPQRRFLERQATYQLDIANVGTADATNVEIAVHLDRGFTFVSTDYEGQYDPNQHTVFWSLANLPQGGNGTVPLTLLPVEEGEQAIRLEARADLGVVAKNERTVAVDSLAELTFSINDVSDPIEVGGETVYEIRLSNSGSRNDSNVRVQLQLPAGLSLLGADGDAQEDGRGGVFFQPRSQLAANDEVIYRVRAQGISPGTHLVKAIVTSDQSTTPVTKEESTMVYSDQ